MNGAGIAAILILAGASIVMLVVYLQTNRKAKVILQAQATCIEENEQLVDEIERVKEELQLIRLKAGESDRLKSAFLCNMSHELRTPLHAIMGFSGLIANPMMPEEDKVTYANIINRNVDSLLEIINDIFDISQFESGATTVDIETVNVNDLLNTLQTWINLEKTNANKEDIIVKINKANKDSNFCIQTDGYKLRRALSHLASNALKYSKDGFIEIGYTFNENSIIDFYIKDEGIGFSKDKLEIIFSQFRQVDETPSRQYGGLGLGLTVAQKFASILNGRLWAVSEPDKGSTFYISIPYS
jgi:signal transduction histidine kinase